VTDLRTTARDDEQVPEPPQPATPARRPGRVDNVLALQRSAGNAAVSQLLRGPVLARDTPGTKTAGPVDNDHALADALKTDDWGSAAATLDRYASDAERTKHLAAMSDWQVLQLAKYMRPGGAGGKYPRPLLPLVELALRPRLDRLFLAEVKVDRWSGAVMWLMAYDEPDRVPAARQVQTLKGDAGVAGCRHAAALILGDDHVVTRTFDFLPLEGKTGAAVRPPATAPMNTKTAAGPPVAVPGGTVETFKEVDDIVQGSGWTGLIYEGADAPRTGWLQFAARECVKYDAKGKAFGYETSVTAQIAGQKKEPLRWGTPVSPWWHIDARSDDVPFYEAVPTGGRSGGAHDAWPKRTAIYDAPDPAPVVVRKAFEDDDTAQVVERVLLHSYLVRGMDVLYENDVVVEFTSRNAKDPPVRKNLAGVGGETTRLLKEHYEALLRRFPAWTFYRRM
jgi:hypothetical protein